MNDKLFSICVLTYRNFDGIYETLDSIFNQDYSQIELIIADDGSPNYFEEIELIRKYIEENRTNNIKNVVYLHLDENQGTVRNCNNALAKSNGEYIKLFGGGDIFTSPRSISEYVHCLDE